MDLERIERLLENGRADEISADDITDLICEIELRQSRIGKLLQLTKRISAMVEASGNELLILTVTKEIENATVAK